MAGNNIRKRAISPECEIAKRQQLSRNDSESSSEDECEFGQKPPSLIDYIKGTLNNYPDGSQILKEIIQNADDAGATRIEFLLDYSTHSCDKIIHPICSHYQGQALYSWNNAKFQTADWKGIQSVGVSGKAKESLKVGRFGLGFVAVYHITDVPIVLSDKSIGLLDPQEQIFHRQPGRKFKLSRFFRDDNYSDHQSCFRTYFGYNGTGEYDGTIFRFPLRTEQCNSTIKPDGVYSAEKVKTTLFEALKAEADNVLIFLKRVKSIKLFTRDPLGQHNCNTFLVKIPDNYLTGVQDSNTLLSDHVLNKQFHKSIKITVNVFPISSTSGDKVWIVLNLIGFPQSPPTLSQFYSDKKLDYLPWIGIAMETGIREDQLATSQTFNFTRDWDGSELVSLIESILSKMMLRFIVPFEHKLTLNSGNLFCFLPTPEPSYLPFNLHGYFALSNDRRRIKWPSRDSDDIDSKWNKLLLGQLGVSAFAIFYRILVHCFHHGNPEVYHYRLLGGATTDSHSIPSTLVNQGLGNIVNDRIVYSHIINEWIRVDDALFHPIQYSIDEYDCNKVKRAIQALLEFLQEPLVILPNDVLSLFNKIDALKCIMDKKIITPVILRQILKNQNSEELIKYFEENIVTHTLVVLSFILSDLDICCDDIPNVLDNIPLLLSASSKSFKFSINSKTPLYIYGMGMNLLDMFPGTEHLFVHPQLPPDSYNCLLTISQRFFGRINIRDISKLRSDSVLLNQLFKLSLESYFKQLTPPVQWNPNRSPFDRDWLKRVWYFIGSDSTLASSLGALPLLPKEDICSENNQLLCIKPTVSSAEYILCSSDARYSPIEDMLVDSGTIFIHFHRFIDCLGSFVVRQLPNGLLTILEKNSSILNSFIRQFNYCSNQELFKNVINVLITDYPFSVDQIHIIKQLPIFPNMIGSHISLIEYSVRVPENINMPGNIKYPSEFLSPDSPSMSILFNKLDVPSLDIDLFVREHMIPFMENLCEEPDSLRNHFQLSQWLLNLLNRLSPELVKFLKLNPAWVADNSNSPILDSSNFHKPSQLFDPNDEILKDLLLTNSRFFPNYEFETYFHITRKKEFFITSTTLVDQNLFEEVFNSAICNFPIILTSPNYEHVWKFRFSNLLTFINSCWTANKLKIDAVSKILESSKIVLPLFERPDNFPVCTPFLGDRTLCTPSSVVFCTGEEVLLIASVRKCVPIFPTNDKFKGLLEYLNCQTSLTGDMIVEQLTAISNSVIPQNEVDKVHNILSHIYDSELILNTSLLPKFVYIKQENLFTYPKKVVKRAPFELEPFFYSFNVLNYSENAWRLFEKHGACGGPSPQQLFDILQHFYDTQSESDNSSIATNLIHNITNYLSERLDRIQQRSLLLLGEDNRLHLALDCLYRDDNLSVGVNIDIDGRIYNFVNSRISNKVSKQFGARSLKYTLLSDDDDAIYGFCDAAGQYEELTTRLNSILQQYASSIDVFKELVQNADDAGANSFRILIDYSSFPSETLLEKSMKHWQGPALYFYNDAQFTDADFINLLKIFGQTKRDDMFKIGKFGLGFNTVYHLTDLPSIVSGTYLYMLDPHKKYIAKRSSKPGIRVDFVKKHNRILLYSDQFSVFNIEQFNCNVFEKKEYKGTLFRLPFRTNSVHSDISTETYGDLKIQELKSLILKEAEATVRFLQHINCIEIFERDKDRNIVSVLRVNKQVNSNPIPNNKTFLSYNSAHFDIILSGATVDPVTLCQSMTITKELEGNTTSEDFIVTYSSGTSQCQAFVRNKRIPNFPFCSIALSTKTLESSTCHLKLRCQLYCFLPLPVTSPYPMFINGYFALDNSRRGLSCTEDGNINTEWNKVLINDALVNALICLLLVIRDRTEVNQYYSLWPTASDATLWCEYSKCTATRVIKSNAPLIICDTSNSTEWLGYRECSFFDCENFNWGLEDFFLFVRKFSAEIGLARFAIIPKSFYSQEVFSTIINFDKNKLYTLSRICIEIIFPNLQKIDLENLYLVLSSLIPLAKDKDNKWIIDLFRSKPSIPCGSRFEWQYRFPHQTINPNSKLAKLYDSSDNRLPHPMFINLCKQNSSVFEGLIALNVIDKKLPVEDLIDRTTCQTDFQMERRKLHCAVIIEYFDKSDYKYTQSETQLLLDALNEIPFVPVCENEVFVRLRLQPNCQFASPNSCSAYNLRFLITPELYSVSEEFIKYKKFFKLFSICMDKSEIRGVMLTKILEIFHQHQTQILNLGLTDSITSTVLSIYEVLIEMSIKRTPTQPTSIILTNEGKEIKHILHNKHWVWHPPSNTFCKMSQIIGSDYQQYNSKFLLCFPYIQLLQNSSHREFFRCLGLQFGMTHNYVIDVITRMKNSYQTTSLPGGDIELVLDLIQKYFHSTHTIYPNLQYILSANNVLLSTSELVRDDMPWKKRLDSANSKFAHPRIPLLCLYNLNVPSSRNALYNSVAFNQIEFGQFEDISTRIENLKREFPNDSTILKEFLQNAEDAQATEFSVILDYKKDYKTVSLCYDKMDHPNWYKYQECASLLIYNNKPFTTEDLAGIQSVGLGGKQNKQTIGKFGLGFNTVYHLTKSPCLLTKRKVNGTFVITYCVFDPYREYLNLSDNKPPGLRLELTMANFMEFSDQFEPFLLPASCCLDLSSEYSLFRIPLFAKTTPESVENNHIAEFLQQASGMTLFLENICNIKVFKFDLFGTISTIGSLNCHFLKRIQQQPRLPISANIFSNPTLYLNTGKSDVKIKRISTIGSSSSHITSTWLICNFQGNLSAFESVCTEITAHKKKYVNEKLTNSIYGGIAFEIPIDSYSYKSCTKKSYLYSYLPIGAALSHHNFPVNINAPFIFDSHRHYLRFQDTTQCGDSADRKWHDAWHIGILKHIIVPMYFSLLVNLKTPQNLGLTEFFSVWELKDYYNWYYSLFPDSVLLERGQTQNSLFLSQLSKELYSLLHTSNQCVLISEDFSKWLSFTGITQGVFRNTCLSNSYLYTLSSLPAVNDEIDSILAKIKYPITAAADHIAVNLKKFRLSFQSINQLHVLNFLNKNTHHLSKNSSFPTKLSNSTLTLKEIISLLKYLLGVSQVISCQYEGIPLKVDSSDTIRNFSKSGSTFESEYSTLLTGYESYFLTPRFPTNIIENLNILCYLKPLNYTFLSQHMNPIHFDLDKMSLFWKFILNYFPRDSSLEEVFGNMNVVPVLRKVSSKRDYLKISQLPCILQRKSSPFYLQNDVIFNILSKLDCPILDLEIFLPTQHFTLSAVKSCLDKYTFDYSPQTVINALGLVIPCSLSNKLDYQEANCLRDLFLTKHMNYDANYLRIISSLKMFVTNSDTLVSLNDCRICFVSIEKIPIVNELNQYFSEKNVTFILTNTEHKTNTITICRGCAITVIDSYQTLFHDYFLPKFIELAIPQQQRLMEFIQTIHSIDSISYLSIIEALKQIPFIQLPGKSKIFLVSELYDSNIELFRSFYSEFLIPKIWLLNNRTVIHKLGLHSHLDLKSVKECAIEVSTKKYGVVSNSKILLPLSSLIELINSVNSGYTNFVEFANIAFLPLWKYQLNFQKEYKLGRFCDANLETQYHCCSTSSWIHCPDIKVVDFNHNLMKCLGIIISPATSDVLPHLINISNNFNSMHQLDKQVYFERTYTYLQNCNAINLSSISGLACIFYDKILYQTRNMVFEIRDEFKPFLFKVPPQLEKYKKFLANLGVLESPTYCHYAAVMKDIALSNSPSTVELYGQMVFLLFISALRELESANQTTLLNLTDTYVLTKNFTCILQSKAIFIDNTKLLILVDSFTSLANFYFLFELPANKHGSCEPPKCLEIKYLSNIIQESLTVKTRATPSIQTDTTIEIQNLLKTQNFYHGLVRIYYNSMKGKGKDNLTSVRIKNGVLYDINESPSIVNDRSYTSIKDILNKLVVIGVDKIEVQVTNLQTGEKLCRGDIHQCFMEDSTLYIQANSQVKDLYCDLTYLLNVYLCNIFSQSLFPLQACLTSHPDKIPFTLNSYNISQCPYLNIMTPQNTPRRAPSGPAPPPLMTRDRLFQIFHRSRNTNSALSRTTPFTAPISPFICSRIPSSPLHSLAPSIPTSPSMPRASLNSSPSLPRTSFPSSPFVRTSTLPSSRVLSLPTLPSTTTTASYDEYTAKLWIRTAQCDLRAAQKLLHRCEEDRSVYTAHACFYCFECAIKSCISVICLKRCYQVNISHERNLDVIIDILTNFLPQDEHTQLVNLCLSLMNYNEAARDPCMTPGIGCCIPIECYSVDAAKEAIESATNILGLIKDKFPEIKGLMFNDEDNVWEHPPITSLLKTHLENIQMRSDGYYETLPEDCQEYYTVARNFFDCLPQTQIIKISKIHNQVCWGNFKRKVEAKFQAVESESYSLSEGSLLIKPLFHGSSRTDPGKIIQNSIGFKVEYSRGGLWGRGLYFAANAAYSHAYSYSVSEERHEYSMFLAKVFVGNSKKLTQDSTIQSPPPGYHTVNGVIPASKITPGTKAYILYEDGLAYPSYLINYIHF